MSCFFLSFDLDWLTQRCLQVYLSDLNQSTLHLRLQQNLPSNPRIEQLINIHTQIISKKIFAHNWTKYVHDERELSHGEIFHLIFSLTEKDFHIDVKDCLERNSMSMIDYSNYIENEDELILMNFLQRVNH